MEKISVFIDNCVFSRWLELDLNDNEKKYIEEIRKLIEDNQIEGWMSTDIEIERIRGTDEQKTRQIKEKWSKVKYCGTITPNFVVGDTNGSFRANLTKATNEWGILAKSIYDDKDSKHVVTAISQAGSRYFITLDSKLINKMKNEEKEYLKKIKIIKPSAFITEWLSISLNKGIKQK